ncbi:MAG: HD domain-containing phosphohydrolase [Bacillota bacterium]|nr:HD domain-containing phosphohydrolase [Bacillota bacterium]
MKFNLAEFLISVSKALDFIEIDLLGVSTNHSKRVAYIAWKIGATIALKRPEMFDLVSLAVLHDNGATMSLLPTEPHGNLSDKRMMMEKIISHCTLGEKNIQSFPFLTKPQDVILCHHENDDGTGFFGRRKTEIPLLAQIIHVADMLDLHFDLHLHAIGSKEREAIIDYVAKESGTLFSAIAAEAFCRVAVEERFWIGLTDDAIDTVIRAEIGSSVADYGLPKIRRITKTFSRIIDAKSAFTQIHSSALAAKMQKMTRFYGMDDELRMKLVIAADLHDLGKLGVSNAILDKEGKLTHEEFDEIKKHPGIAKECLDAIAGFEEITEWIYEHHERLDGSGYPRGLTAEQIGFNARLLACLDIFQALHEDRPYRAKMNTPQALAIMRDMAHKNKIDAAVVDDIGVAFRTRRKSRYASFQTL